MLVHTHETETLEMGRQVGFGDERLKLPTSESHGSIFPSHTYKMHMETSIPPILLPLYSTSDRSLVR